MYNVKVGNLYRNDEFVKVVDVIITSKILKRIYTHKNRIYTNSLSIFVFQQDLKNLITDIFSKEK